MSYKDSDCLTSNTNDFEVENEHGMDADIDTDFYDDEDEDDLEFYLISLSDYAHVVEIMKNIINILLSMSTKQAYVFLKYVEHDYEMIADCELGDFVHDFMLTAYWSYFDHPDIEEIHSALEVLIDDQNYNSDMLITIFNDIQKIAQNVDDLKS